MLGRKQKTTVSATLPLSKLNAREQEMYAALHGEGTVRDAEGAAIDHISVLHEHGELCVMAMSFGGEVYRLGTVRRSNLDPAIAEQMKPIGPKSQPREYQKLASLTKDERDEALKRMGYTPAGDVNFGVKIQGRNYPDLPGVV